MKLEIDTIGVGVCDGCLVQFIENGRVIASMRVVVSDHLLKAKAIVDGNEHTWDLLDPKCLEITEPNS